MTYKKLMKEKIDISGQTWVVSLEEWVHEGKDLFHHRVLPQIVAAFDQLRPPPAVRAQTRNLFRRVDPTNASVLISERLVANMVN